MIGDDQSSSGKDDNKVSRVAIIGENSIGYIKMLIDIWNAGDCAVLIDWRIPEESAYKMLKEAGVVKCMLGSRHTIKYKNLFLCNFEVSVFDDACYGVSILSDNVFDAFDAKYSDEEAVVIYSSGTTGKRKGVILSHYAINKNADAIIDYMQLEKEDCIYIAKSLSHSSTLIGEMLVALKTRTKLIVAPTFIPPRLLIANIEKTHSTIACLNPSLLLLLVIDVQRRGCVPQSLRAIYVSGSILTSDLCGKARRLLPNTRIYNVYGLSEAGPRVTAQRGDCCGSNSVGKPIDGVTITVLNEHGQIAKQGENGLIYVKTPSRFSGYVSGFGKRELACGEWLCTGDIGHFDAQNELYIVGRIDDLIIIDSHNIYPSEIEEIIINMSNVSECCVVDIYNKGEMCLACLYAGELSVQQMRQSLANVLAFYETPKLFVKCDCIPKTDSGKIVKHDVRRIIMDRLEE